MERRDFLTALAAGGGVCSLSTPASASGFGRLSRQSTPDGPDDAVQRDDWVPHHTVDIDADGTAMLSIALEGENAPASATLTRRRATVLDVVEGESALSGSGDTLSWDVDRASSVGFRVQLGESSGRGLETGKFDHSIASDVNELVQVVGWPEGPETLPSAHRFTFEPPDGWSVVSPGERVATDTYDLTPAVVQYGASLTNLFAVGDFDVRERDAGETTIRLAQLPAAEHPHTVEEVFDLLADTTPVIEEMYGYRDRYPWAAILVPSDLVRGGFIKDDSIFFGDNFPLVSDGGSTYTHELGGLYTRAVTCSSTDCSRWYIFGGKAYVGRYALFAADRLEWEGLLRMFDAWMSGSNDARDHEDPLGVPATDSPMTKGTALYALLDVEIRSRTDGEHDVGSWLAQIADQRILEYRGEDRHLIRDEEARPLLYDITGVDYTEFYERFVHGSEFPENFFEEQFSLENPWPVYAAFEYPSVEMPEGEISVDEPIEVTVELRNDADQSQQRTVPLVVDGSGVAARDVQLDPGAATTVTLEHTFTSPGEYEVQIPPVRSETISVTGSGISIVGPGFGAVTALTGLGAGVGYHLLDRRDDD